MWSFPHPSHCSRVFVHHWKSSFNILRSDASTHSTVIKVSKILRFESTAKTTDELNVTRNDDSKDDR
jgi:hypothetical protein